MLFINNWECGMIRLLGVSLKGLVDERQFKSDPIFPSEKRKLVFIKVIDSIRDRFGEDSVKRCAAILERL
jgi:hypothetical protein